MSQIYHTNIVAVCQAQQVRCFFCDTQNVTMDSDVMSINVLIHNKTKAMWISTFAVYCWFIRENAD